MTYKKKTISSILRVIVLASGTYVTFFFANMLYNNVNNLLVTWEVPCLQLISYLAGIIPAVAIFHGIYTKGYFWQRSNVYNKKFFVSAYTLGMILALLPSTTFPIVRYSATQACLLPSSILEEIIHIISTGTITTIMAFIGVDIGVFLEKWGNEI